MANPRFPAIPEPGATVEALLATVRAVKEAVEQLTGQRGGAAVGLGEAGAGAVDASVSVAAGIINAQTAALEARVQALEAEVRTAAGAGTLDQRLGGADAARGDLENAVRALQLQDEAFAPRLSVVGSVGPTSLTLSGVAPLRGSEQLGIAIPGSLLQANAVSRVVRMAGTAGLLSAPMQVRAGSLLIMIAACDDDVSSSSVATSAHGVTSFLGAGTALYPIASTATITLFMNGPTGVNKSVVAIELAK